MQQTFILYFLFVVTIAFTAVISCTRPAQVGNEDNHRLQPFTENPFYWQYKGEPILLIGASDYHNIFQRPDLVEHLEIIRQSGGNYIRNTMASREILEDHRDLWPFEIVEETEDSLIFVYDLDRWNDEYWDRFSTMLEETARHDMIVEIEIWERHDFYRTRDQAGWIRHPYNPDNNVNYDPEQVDLPVGEYPNPGEDPYNPPSHPFFRSVPDLENNTSLLPYQQAFVDKILSYSFDYDHVMYNMNNETQEANEWGEYWANYILKKADEIGKQVELTDMQDAHDVTDESVARMMDSELYTFVDISQNNFQTGDLHWERIQYLRNYLSDNPKPVTNIKVYGTDEDVPPADLWNTARDGIERFWRNIIGGTSSTRFHRPPWGIGLNSTARAHVESARMFSESFDIFRAEPDNARILNREEGSAYLTANPGVQYAVYLPSGGDAEIKLAGEKDVRIRWLDASNSRWMTTDERQSVSQIELSAPGDGHWIAVISVN